MEWFDDFEEEEFEVEDEEVEAAAAAAAAMLKPSEEACCCRCRLEKWLGNWPGYISGEPAPSRLEALP